MSANQILKQNARQAVEQVIAANYRDHAAMCAGLLALYDLHLPKILDGMVDEMVDQAFAIQSHQLFIGQGLSRLPVRKTFIWHNGHGDIEYSYLGTCRKGKRGKELRHLCVSTEQYKPFREQFGPLVLSVMHTDRDGFFGNEVSDIDLRSCQALLTFACVQDGSIFANRGYRYHLDLSIPVETFKKDMVDGLIPANKRTRFNAMDERPRNKQYTLIIDGERI